MVHSTFVYFTSDIRFSNSMPYQSLKACYHPSRTKLFKLYSSILLNGRPLLNLGFTQRTPLCCCSKLYNNLEHKHASFSKSLVKPSRQKNYHKNQLNNTGRRWLIYNLDDDASHQPLGPYPRHLISTPINSTL